MQTEFESNWDRYYEAARGAEPHWTLLTALKKFEAEGVQPGKAVDLGCGQGRDTLEMLTRGWSVIAVDREKAGLDALRTDLNAECSERLEAVESDMESFQIPPVLLVNASLSLPFCRKDSFSALWRQIIIQLAPGGRFAGHFFGDNDDWSSSGRIIHYTSRQLKNVLYGFQLELFSESESDFPSASGKVKHWHIFQVVAKKPSAKFV